MARTPADEIDTMAGLRACIDAVDADLMDLLAERWSYTERAAGLKAREGLSAAAPGRVAAVLANVKTAAEARGVDGDMVAAMWQIMIETVIAREERLIGKEGKDG
jgi:isochorismate pyruvate lyase